MAKLDKEIRIAQNRAQKNAWAAGLLTLFLPFGIGQIYTARYGVAVLALLGFSFCVSLEDVLGEDASETLLAMFAIGTTVENVRSIRQSRQFLRERGLPIGTQTQELRPPAIVAKPKVRVLKAIKAGREVSLADLVIETGMEIDELRALLLTLEREDLIRSRNREGDGAVVYRVV